MPPLDLEQLNRLILLVAEGQSDALDGILRLVGRRMFALIRGIVKNEADAEDVLSDCFLKIARGAHAFRAGTNGYAWCMRIARNTSFDLLRKRKIRAEEDLDAFFHLSDERYSPARRLEALALEEAIEKLSAEERRCIYFRYYLDLTVREVAQELGISKSAAARKLDGAEQKLLALLAGKKGE